KVVNSTLKERAALTATVSVHDIPGLTTRYTERKTLDVPANDTVPALAIPDIAGLSKTYFIRLQLDDAIGASVSRNVYWYSTARDGLGQPDEKASWYMTPIETYADLTGLERLPLNRALVARARV